MKVNLIDRTVEGLLQAAAFLGRHVNCLVPLCIRPAGDTDSNRPAWVREHDGVDFEVFEFHGIQRVKGPGGHRQSRRQIPFDPSGIAIFR